jgi:sugar phosphate isomerase/epimerase
MKLAAFPKCFMDALVRDHTMTVFEWIAMATELPIDGLEMYDGFFETLEESYLDRVRTAIEKHNFVMPMLCCSPDFTYSDPKARHAQVEREKRMIDVTAHLGGSFCRVLSGQRRPEVSKQEGVRWVVECIKSLIDYAAERNVILVLENHYKDNYWRFPEFAQDSNTFMQIINQLDSPRVGVQYDPSNAILAGEDHIELLHHIKHRVATMHASDRRLLPGHTPKELRCVEDSVGYAAILSHGVVGQGLVNYLQIFSILREVGFDGWVSIEDGINGLDEIRRSAEFLRSMMLLT